MKIGTNLMYEIFDSIESIYGFEAFEKVDSKSIKQYETPSRIFHLNYILYKNNIGPYLDLVTYNSRIEYLLNRKKRLKCMRDIIGDIELKIK